MTLKFLEFDNIKPSSEVAAAWKSLEDRLVSTVKNSEVLPTPKELLQHALAIAPSELDIVVNYLAANKFVQRNEPSIAALYLVLGVNPLTSRGRQVALVLHEGKPVIDFFPGYTLGTNLFEFLMRELPEDLTAKGKGRGERGYRLNPRKARADAMIRGITSSVISYEQLHWRKALRLESRGMGITIGGFLALPPEIRGKSSDVYELLERFGFKLVEPPNLKKSTVTQQYMSTK